MSPKEIEFLSEVIKILPYTLKTIKPTKKKYFFASFFLKRIEMTRIDLSDCYEELLLLQDKEFCELLSKLPNVLKSQCK